MSKEGKMEKSFLNFKAAHPDWTPNDPHGSDYLTRMADLSAAHPPGLARRRILQRGVAASHISPSPSADMDSTVHLHAPGGPSPGGVGGGDKYDRALQSVVRRRGGVVSSSMCMSPCAGSSCCCSSSS